MQDGCFRRLADRLQSIKISTIGYYFIPAATIKGMNYLRNGGKPLLGNQKAGMINGRTEFYVYFQ
jgi:hypothetical protein